MTNAQLLKLATEMVVHTYEGCEPERSRWALVLATCLQTEALTQARNNR